MIRCKLCVLAEGIVRDAETNTISVFNIVEDIPAQGFPLFFPKITFFTLWERDLTDPARYDAEFSVTLNDQRLHTTPVNIEFMEARRHRSIVAVQGMVIPGPGQLVFSLRIPGGIEAIYTTTVNAPPSVVSSG